MKISKLTRSAMTLILATFLITACSDDKNDNQIKPSVEPQQSSLNLRPEAQLYKMTQEEGCRIYTLERDISTKDAEEAGIQSPMAFCEERLKPVLNSAIEEYDRDKVFFTCFRKNEANEIISKSKSCYEI